ncbi:Protein CBG07390 [Caenorhabditis briggsae]|uniref:Protein CBG07390 n=1 Tax=Caenorhabditis briggsae TaxID=6238 RepID=A8X4V6_CAEBR|nr:Protein CBG07390 [Caenorhabditis briggsae]CAP27666.2 Protein CBG07390 [Caenorhabditis briggsae]
MENDNSFTIWNSYKTIEQRAGPLSTPATSTPLKTPRSHRGPEEPNVTTIAMENDQDENRNLCISTQSINTSCRNCRELSREVQELRKTVEKQAQYINILKKTLNSTSEMDSSESQHGPNSTASSASKKARIQRVTPTKRESSSASTSGSLSTSSSTSTPIVRQILQQLTPRSVRSPAGSRGSATSNRQPVETPIMARNVRQATTRSSSNESPSAQVMPTPTMRNARIPPPLRSPQSLPLGARQAHFETPPSLRMGGSERRTHSRRRLFADEDAPTTNRAQQPPPPPARPMARPQQRSARRNLNEWLRTRSENAIEHLPISPVKDDQWSQACPPRVHLERNRPEFIERVEARQSIIRAASEKRAEIEQKKRVSERIWCDISIKIWVQIAARLVASGQRSVDSVRRDLFADSTAVKAFYEKDMRDITMKNIRKSQSYQNRMYQRMATVDKHANRILAQSHSLRARSTSRSRQQH